MSFNGKNILIVGGSSGIGLSLVNMLIQAGANVYNASRNPSNEWLEGVKHISFDVLDDANLPPDYLPEELHGFVYSVGSINLKPFQRITAQNFIDEYRLNVVGAAMLIQQALKALKTANGSSVVLISSVAAKTGMGFHTSIASAKGGLEGLAISLAAELSAQNIRVNVVAPSLTDTPLGQNLLNTPEKQIASAKRHPLGRYGLPKDIASAILFLLSPENSWVTGQVLGIDGGMSNLKTNL